MPRPWTFSRSMAAGSLLSSSAVTLLWNWAHEMPARPKRRYSVYSPLSLRSMSVETEETWPGCLVKGNRVHCQNNWFVYGLQDFLMLEVIA